MPMTMAVRHWPRRATAHGAPALPVVGAARRHRSGFWTIAAVFVTAMAFSTVPTPLYPLYQARDGFSSFTVTVVFAVYAVGVLTSLLLVGHISDQIGRKKALTAALVAEVIAAGLFLAGHSLPVLIVARFVTGLGVGVLTAAATAHLQDLHAAQRPGASTRRFEIVSTAANIGGLGLGPLVAGALAQYFGAPLHLPYVVFGVLLLAGVAAVALAPETVDRSAARPAYRPQRVVAGLREPGYPLAAAAGFTSMAVFGLFTSLAPGFVGETLHHPSRALAGLVVFTVFGAAATAQVLTGRLGDRSRWAIGLVAQAVGIAAVAIGVHLGSLVLFLLAAIISGVGAGVLFKAAVGHVAATAAPSRRGEALAGVFLASYLGLALLPVGLGVATRFLPVTTATAWFAVVVLALLGAVVVLLARHRGGGSGTRRYGAGGGTRRRGAAGRADGATDAAPAESRLPGDAASTSARRGRNTP
ncbi:MULTISPECIES: MFS transporter [Streptomyces]|nr:MULTISPECIES: MFS transporter [Streptomyces]